jgi:hypothetical protein
VYEAVSISVTSMIMEIPAVVGDDRSVRVNAQRSEEDVVEFLVEFEVNVPQHTLESEVRQRETAEAAAAAKLVDEGHLLRVWKRPVGPGG